MKKTNSLFFRARLETYFCTMKLHSPTRSPCSWRFQLQRSLIVAMTGHPHKMPVQYSLSWTIYLFLSLIIVSVSRHLALSFRFINQTSFQFRLHCQFPPLSLSWQPRHTIVESQLLHSSPQGSTTMITLPDISFIVTETIPYIFT